MTDAYQPSDQLGRPGGIPPEAEAVVATPTVPPTMRPAGQPGRSADEAHAEEGDDG